MVNDRSVLHDPQRIDDLLGSAIEAASGGDAEVEATYRATDAALTRFANSRIHQNVAEHDATLRLRVIRDGRTGVAGTNRLDAEGIRAAATRAAEIAARSAANPDQPPLPRPDGATRPEVGHVAATAAADPELRAAGASAVIAAADDARLEASGAFTTEVGTLAVANSAGVRSRQMVTQARLLTVMMGDGGASGYAQAFGTDVREIDAAAVGEEAATRGRGSANGIDLPAGEYDVVLDEYAVANLLEYASLVSFGALAVEEGRSFMALGERVMGDNVTIWDDGQDPSGMPSPIDFEGVAKQRVDIISGGVATGLVHDSATARRAGTESTGHALPQPNTWGPIAWNLFMAPGSATPGTLRAGIKRGLWVTRFHYVNIVHPKKAILTGMTKDGTFLIEDGEVVGPVRNLRFTQSVPEAFSRIDAIGTETRLVGADYTGVHCRVPAVRIRGFTFTGATAAEEPA